MIRPSRRFALLLVLAGPALHVQAQAPAEEPAPAVAPAPTNPDDLEERMERVRRAAANPIKRILDAARNAGTPGKPSAVTIHVPARVQANQARSAPAARTGADSGDGPARRPVAPAATATAGASPTPAAAAAPGASAPPTLSAARAAAAASAATAATAGATAATPARVSGPSSPSGTAAVAQARAAASAAGATAASTQAGAAPDSAAAGLEEFPALAVSVPDDPQAAARPMPGPGRTPNALPPPAAQAASAGSTTMAAAGAAAPSAAAAAASSARAATAAANPAATQAGADADDDEPKLLVMVEPELPRRFVLDLGSGSARFLVGFSIAPDGSVRDVRVEDGPIDRRARTAVRQAVERWRYAPLPQVTPYQVEVVMNFDS